MRSSSSLDVNRHIQRSFNVAYLLAILIATVCANAQTPIPAGAEASAAEQKEPERHENAKKVAKYDVSRIGSRGIGRGFNIYSMKREYELGESLAAAFDRYTRTVNDPVLNDYVNRLSQKLVRNSDAQIPFTVKIIDSGEIPRAYGLPGGFLYIDSALIFAAESEAELAGVIAREIAHVAARHATRALTRKQLFNAAGTLSMLAGPVGVVLQNAGGIAGPLSVKKFGRDAEYEADLLAIEYAYSAGYDPEALLSALEKMHAMEVDRSAALAKIPGAHLVGKVPFHQQIARGFANYPLTDERIHRLQSEITTFLPDRKDYVVDTNEFQEIKEHMLSLRGPLQLRRHKEDADPRAPVLRRSREGDTDVAASGNLQSGFSTLR